ncbi:hypothetical protein U9M48_023784 [Paspalum notatum var. saurae]|uniref:Uncharacterized protein n=1 Tax=Paspalum notatum var. saurae TaxID=547442 RepID=A0AAQ3TRD9_PASNO
MASGQTMSISSLCLEPPHAFLRVHGVDPPPHGGHGVDPPPHGGHGVDPPPHNSPGSHGVDLPPCVSSRPQRHRSASVGGRCVSGAGDAHAATQRGGGSAA